MVKQQTGNPVVPVRLDKEHQKMLLSLCKKTGLSASVVLRKGLARLHRKTFPKS